VVRKIVAREGPLGTRTHYDLPLPGGEGKALKLNFHRWRDRDPGLRRRDRAQNRSR